MKILLVEDDESLNQLIKIYLKGNDYQVDSFTNGKDAYDSFVDTSYDMVITDIMMPIMDGFKLAEEIRKTNKSIPILFMSAKDDKPSKQLGYALGIDDYIVKPFDVDELIMKIKAILRRANIKESHTLVVGNLTMNEEEHTAYVDKEILQLTVREFDILYKLLSNPKITFTRSKLMDSLWDYDSSATSRTVDVYMAKIREKVQNCNGFEITTVHGLGYKVVLKNEK